MTPPAIRLSTRQQQVAHLLDANCDYKVIAQKLGMSYNRVAQHVKRIAFLVEPDPDIRAAQGPKLTVVVWMRHCGWLTKQAMPTDCATPPP